MVKKRTQVIKVKDYGDPVDTGEVVAAADAMRQKRAELIAQPLSFIYVQLARAALEAARAFNPLSHLPDGHAFKYFAPEASASIPERKRWKL